MTLAPPAGAISSVGLEPQPVVVAIRIAVRPLPDGRRIDGCEQVIDAALDGIDVRVARRIIGHQMPVHGEGLNGRSRSVDGSAGLPITAPSVGINIVARLDFLQVP